MEIGRQKFSQLLKAHLVTLFLLKSHEKRFPHNSFCILAEERSNFLKQLSSQKARYELLMGRDENIADALTSRAVNSDICRTDAVLLLLVPALMSLVGEIPGLSAASALQDFTLSSHLFICPFVK